MPINSSDTTVAVDNLSFPYTLPAYIIGAVGVSGTKVDVETPLRIKLQDARESERIIKPILEAML